MLYVVPILIAAVILAVVAIVSRKPSQFRITRSALVEASPSEIFELINNFRKWEAWSPWARLDPQAAIEYDGADRGVGAKYRWSGNKQVGEGSNTIIESREAEVVRIRLEFLKPFRATNTAEFILLPRAGATEVTWSMFGTSNFVCKLAGLFMDCDKMVGSQFEQGLANIKSLVEKQPVG